MLRATSLSMFFVFLFFLALNSVEATIQQIDACSVPYTKDQPIPIIRNQLLGQSVVVRGDLVNLITGVLAPPGIAVELGVRRGGGGLNTSVEMKINPGPSAAVGDHNIKLNYAVEAGQPDVFKIRVKQIEIKSITQVPAGNLSKGTPVTITATGTGLAGVRLRPVDQGSFTNFQNVTNTNTTYSFKGNAERSFNTSGTSIFFDSAIAAQQNACSSIDRSLVAVMGYSVGLADLKISKATGVYRFLPQPEICAGVARIETDNKFCTSPINPMPTPTSTNPHIEKVQHVGGITYVVTNPSPYLITSPIKVQLKNGNALLKEDTINGLAANAHKVLTYSRPNNNRMLMRDLGCPNSCYDLDVAPNNWRDPIYTTIVDVNNQIPESDENNNTVASD